MKTFLRVIIGLAALAVIAILAIIYVPAELTKPTENLAADWKPAAGQGEYAMRMADCAACHTAPGGAFLAGGRAIDSPMGTIWASNITPDKDTGIGAWSLDEFRGALVDGIGKGGRHLYPAMPYENYRKLSEQDIRSIYDYLMHDVKPVSNRTQRTALSFPFNQRWGIRVWNWAALGEAGFKAKPDKIAADPVLARGAYLVEGPGHCAACHSPRTPIMSQNGTDAGSATFLTGGVIGNWPAPDLRTAHSALMKWSDQDLLDYLTTGRNSHDVVSGEMKLAVEESLQYMTPDDAKAMVAYLRAIGETAPTPEPPAPADQKVADRIAAANDPTTTKLKAATDLSLGEQLYLNNCSACHMADGKGAASVFPSLVGNALVTAKQTGGLTDTILNGAEMPSTAARSARLRMPAFANRLSDDDVAVLESFLRSGWGNSAGAVTAADVAPLRKTQ
ncbi:c-type cytochrome [Aestuariivirga sp.]|uniref:c-type cytochrome n=1 Tax=Aestuariivirga sp. TaxID=2650926 RepID=UPI0039E60C30